MLTNVYRLLSAINCLTKILDKAQFDTVALLHLNKTTDVADIIYTHLSEDTSLVWMRFNMDNSATLQNRWLNDTVLTKIFSVYALDVLSDWQYVLQFTAEALYNYRENHMYIVNKYSVEHLTDVAWNSYHHSFYNFGILFWNVPDMAFFTTNGFEKTIYMTPIENGQCSDDTYSKIFYNKLLNFHGENLVIYGQTDPPRIVRTATSVNGQYEHSLGGYDVLIADTIANHLNATAKFRVMMRIYYEGFLNQSLESKKPKTNIEQNCFHVDRIGRYDLEIVDDVDSAMYIYTRAGVELNAEQVNFDLHRILLKRRDYTFLYPHDTDSFVLIVPRRLKSKTDYSHILNSPLIFVWGPITVVATVVRFIFNKIVKTDKKLTDTYFETFGLSLGMSYGAAITTAAEKLFLWWFCLGTMLSGTLLSSDMLQGFALHRNVPAINNLKELEMSGMEIYLPNYLDSVKYFFASNPLNFKLVNTVDFAISEMIASQNTSNAYVIREKKFNILFKDSDAWHVLEHFGTGYLSYKLRFGSGMDYRMNELIQRCVDHGIIKYLIAKNKRLLGGSRLERFEKKDAKVPLACVEPVSLGDVQETFVMYAIGITLSSIGFIFEKSVVWKHLQFCKITRGRFSRL